MEIKTKKYQNIQNKTFTFKQEAMTINYCKNILNIKYILVISILDNNKLVKDAQLNDYLAK